MRETLFRLNECPCCERGVSAIALFKFLLTYRFKCVFCGASFAPTRISSVLSSVIGVLISGCSVIAFNLEYLPSLIIGALFVSIAGLFFCPLERESEKREYN